MTPTAPARFYFNLRSPYSWLAVHDLTTRHPRLAAALDWRPFWEPDQGGEKLLAEAGGRFLYTPMTPEKHRYILADVRRLARARGLDITWPVDREPHWEVAHLGYLAAEQAGRGRAFAVAASRARWERGMDISDPEQVGRIGVEIGLDADRVATAWQDPGLVALGTAALYALYDDSVFGVPYFLCGRERFWGVDRLPDFVACVAEHPLTAADPASAADEPSADAGVPMLLDGAQYDHAGGCG